MRLRKPSRDKQGSERGMLQVQLQGPSDAVDVGAGPGPGPGLGSPAAETPEDQSMLASGPSSRPSARLQVAGLLVLAAAVTAAGVFVGRRIEPATVTVQVTTTEAATVTTKKPPAPVKWGPFKVVRFGRVTPGGTVAAALAIGRQLVVIGGAGGRDIFTGPAGRPLPRVARLPHSIATAAAFASGPSIFVVGGSQAGKPTDAILELRLKAGKLVTGLRFTEPLAEAGVVSKQGFVYLAGGWTGTAYATAVIRFAPPDQATLVARLPAGVRSPAAVQVGHLIYVAGGRTESGLSRSVYSVDTTSGAVKTVGTLPRGVDRALLVASGSQLYLLGGRAAGGKVLDTVIRIDPRTGKTAGAGRMSLPLAGAIAVPFGKSTIVVGTAGGLIYRLDPS